MKAQNSAVIEDALCRMFPQNVLRSLARETGLVKRERKIDPVAMFWVLTLSFGVRLQRTLASLKRNYENKSGKNLSDSSWYERFTPELVAFLKACVMQGIEHLAQEPRRQLKDKLSCFKDLLIQDSTIIRLHEALAKKWPAVRSRKVAAGVKVSMLVSAVTDGPKRIAICGERTNEVKTLRIGPWVKDRILLIDLGFYKHQTFARIKENGGFFVSRLKDNAKPVVTRLIKKCRGNCVDVVGKKVSEILPKLKREVLDVEVEVKLKRRKYNGKQKGDTDRFRLVAVYNKEEKKYHTYLTNITEDVLKAEDIAALYAARWDVEIIFKELKSKYALDIVKTTNPQIIEAYIWTAMLTLLVSRRIYTTVLDLVTPEKAPRYTRLRHSNVFAEHANDHLTAILAHCGIKHTYIQTANVYCSQALDPHVNRERLMDKWRS